MIDIDWANEEWLWGLFLPALLFLFTIWQNRSRHSKTAASAKTRWATAGLGGVKLSPKQRGNRPKYLLYIALAFLTLAIAQPRWGSEKRITFERSREIIIALDLSKSMLAEDLKPSRLERAKLSIESMLDTLEGESVGLVVFAGTAFLQSPMSPDYQILRSFLERIDPSFIPQGGTNYEAMLETALDSFKQSDNQADRFLIIMSDGESLDSDWRSQAEQLPEQNVRAIALGYGTTAGSFIPDGNGGFLKDSAGAVVLSRLEPATLKEIAQISKGEYRQADLWVDLPKIVGDIVERGRASEVEREIESQLIERYVYVLAPGLFFLLLSLYLEFPSVPKARTFKTEAVQ